MAGASVTFTAGSRVTVAVAKLAGSVELVAFTVTICGLATKAGAVNRPAAVMLPTKGVSDQITGVPTPLAPGAGRGDE